MRQNFDIWITLLSIVVLIILVTVMHGCAAGKGLHKENWRRNSAVKYEMKHEYKQLK